MNGTYETKESNLVGAGQKLLAHSKATEFTANRGLVIDMFPFIYAASERMSAKAISEFLEKEQKIKLSSVTINKALRDPAKSWNQFFDLIEPDAHIFAKDYGDPLGKILFEEKFFFTIKAKWINAAAKMIVKENVARSATVLRNKWFSIDWETRLKARQFLAHRLGGK